jgi:hypothetical protein
LARAAQRTPKLTSDLLTSACSAGIRFINISPDATVGLTLTENGAPTRWTSVERWR